MAINIYTNTVISNSANNSIDLKPVQFHYFQMTKTVGRNWTHSDP